MSKDSVLGLFRQHADTHPERPALVDRERSFSYRELDRLSDRLAAHLARRGVARGELLPLLAERSAELVIAILAAAKCAAAYVPVDRRQPDRRKREVLRQCQAPLALATHAEDLPGQPVEVIAQALATSAAGSAVCDLHLGHHRRTQGRGDRESLPGQPRGLAQPALQYGSTEPHHPDGRRRLRRFPMGNLVHPVRRRLPPPGARRGAPRPGGAAGILRRAADQPRLRAYRDGARAGGAARPAVAGAALPVLRRGKTAAGRNRRAALYRGGLLRPDRGHGLRHLPHRRRRSTSATRLDRHAHRRLRGIHPRRRRPALPWRPTR